METPMTKTNKIHPHKFAMWVAIGSISMMFAGLTSAYIVRHAQGNWVYYALPSLFTYSTFCIVASSITMIMALRSFKKGMVARSQNMILVTLLLGIALSSSLATCKSIMPKESEFTKFFIESSRNNKVKS